jgi:hypothetical protein
MHDRPPRQQFITNASERADGFSTRTVAYLPGTINPFIRLIEIEPRDITWQQARYASGLWFCLPPAEFEGMRDLIDKAPTWCERCNRRFHGPHFSEEA